MKPLSELFWKNYTFHFYYHSGSNKRYLNLSYVSEILNG